MAVDSSRLKRIPLFATLTDAQLDTVAARLEERHVERGRHLTTEHGSGYFFFVIDEGAAEVSHDAGEVVAMLGPGDFFGEAAIFRTRRRTATVTTTADTVVFAMFGADFAVLVEQIPELKAEIDAALAARQ